MSAKLLKLKQDRAAAFGKMQDAQKRAQAKDATPEQKVAATTEWDVSLAAMESLDDEIAAEQRESDTEAAASLDRDARTAAVQTRAGPRTVARSHTPSHEPVVTNLRERSTLDPRRGFRSAGDFGAAVMGASMPGHSLDPRLAPLGSATGLSQAVGSDGGFLVPPEFSNVIWDGMNRAPENLLARTDQYTVEGESLTFNANSETSRAAGSRWGGVRGYWIAEAGQIPSSKPGFRQVKIEPQQLAVLVYATDKLLRNAAALDQYLTRAAQSEILFLVNDAIINGSGVGQPKGILNGVAETTSCRVAVAKESGQGAATIVKANIDKMWSRMHPNARANAVWFINTDTEPQLENLSMAVGTGGAPVYMPPGGIADAPLGRLKGRQVIPIEFCPTLGTEGDIILADLSSYCSGVRGGVDSAISMHLRFDYAETAFRFMFEADGQPWLASPITPYKGNAKQSTIITLATRA